MFLAKTKYPLFPPVATPDPPHKGVAPINGTPFITPNSYLPIPTLSVSLTPQASELAFDWRPVQVICLVSSPNKMAAHGDCSEPTCSQSHNFSHRTAKDLRFFAFGNCLAIPGLHFGPIWDRHNIFFLEKSIREKSLRYRCLHVIGIKNPALTQNNKV